MASTELTFSSAEAHRRWLSEQARLPRGFRAGTAELSFLAPELGRTAAMRLTLIALDRPTPSFAAAFTRNAFPGAPVRIGRQRLGEATLGAVVINNKVSNVCAPGGVEAAERVCVAVGRALGLHSGQVLPCSTGVIGWQLPAEAIIEAVPTAVAALAPESALAAAEAILTTDLYPKIRAAPLAGGTVLGFAKGAGMVEPNLATMLVYLLTDLAVPREWLRGALARAVDESFNCISIDSDTSTSDTVLLASSNQVPCDDLAAFESALLRICRDLAEDIVRNGEGVHHVLRAEVRGAPSIEVARGIGKSIVNSPLVQCAVCGNDPNVGRVVMAIGKYLGSRNIGVDPLRCVVRLGGEEVFVSGSFHLSPAREQRLVAHLRSAELYASVSPIDGLTFRPPIRYPPHERSVDLSIELGLGLAAATVLGGDRSLEYISENADYRS